MESWDSLLRAWQTHTPSLTAPRVRLGPRPAGGPRYTRIYPEPRCTQDLGIPMSWVSGSLGSHPDPDIPECAKYSSRGTL